jgi:nucleotide-binding universal stress UspA family protein
MFNNVLVGVDGRSGGRDAVALAAQLGTRDGPLTLTRVFAGLYMPSHAITPGMVEEERAAAEADLEQARAEAGVDATLVLAEALTPAQGLLEQAEELEADLLVLGSSHRGPWGRAMLGDDTRTALDGAPCAVAVAPKGYAGAARPFATIGVGFDGSPESVAAVEVARRLAERTNARIRAHEVVSIPSYSYTGVVGPIFEGVDQMVEEAAARAGALPGVDGSAEYGLPGEELAAFSAEVDLLIVGCRRYGPLHRVISGSTARYLQRHARGPLLVLPRGTRFAEAGDAGAGEGRAASETPTRA